MTERSIGAGTATRGIGTAAGSRPSSGELRGSMRTAPSPVKELNVRWLGTERPNITAQAFGKKNMLERTRPHSFTREGPAARIDLQKSRSVWERPQVNQPKSINAAFMRNTIKGPRISLDQRVTAEQLRNTRTEWQRPKRQEPNKNTVDKIRWLPKQESQTVRSNETMRTIRPVEQKSPLSFPRSLQEGNRIANQPKNFEQRIRNSQQHSEYIQKSNQFRNEFQFKKDNPDQSKHPFVEQKRNEITHSRKAELRTRQMHREQTRQTETVNKIEKQFDTIADKKIIHRPLIENYREGLQRMQRMQAIRSELRNLTITKPVESAVQNSTNTPTLKERVQIRPNDVLQKKVEQRGGIHMMNKELFNPIKTQKIVEATRPLLQISPTEVRLQQIRAELQTISLPKTETQTRTQLQTRSAIAQVQTIRTQIEQNMRHHFPVAAVSPEKTVNNTAIAKLQEKMQKKIQTLTQTQVKLEKKIKLPQQTNTMDKLPKTGIIPYEPANKFRKDLFKSLYLIIKKNNNGSVYGYEMVKQLPIEQDKNAKSKTLQNSTRPDGSFTDTIKDVAERSFDSVEALENRMDQLAYERTAIERVNYNGTIPEEYERDVVNRDEEQLQQEVKQMKTISMNTNSIRQIHTDGTPIENTKKQLPLAV